MNKVEELNKNIEEFLNDEELDNIQIDNEGNKYIDHADEDWVVEDDIDEVAVKKKKVVRGGKVVIKMVCPDGFKFNPKLKACVKIGAAEKKRRSVGAKKGARKSKGKSAQRAKAAARSAKKRVALGL